MRTVIFVTTVFADVENGPGVYSKYLWEEFRESPDFNFVVLAPDVAGNDSRIISFDSSDDSATFYGNMEARLKEFIRSRPNDKIITHLNIPHSLSDVPAGCKNIVQANDYDAAILSRDVISAVRANGLKRLFSLFWRRFREEKVFKNADIILANSKFTAEILAKEYPLKTQDIRVVYKSVDIELFAPSSTMATPPANLKLNDDAFKLLFVGTNWQRKGLDLLFQAVSSLVANKYDLEVLIVGPEAFESSKSIRESIEQSEVAERFHFAGRVSRQDMPAYYGCADLAVLPSRAEALGVAVIESLAAGLPVVATNVGGIPEIIGDHQVGVLVPNENSKALAEAIASLIDNTDLYKKMRANTVARAADFSKHKMLGEVKNIYLELFQ